MQFLEETIKHFIVVYFINSRYLYNISSKCKLTVDLWKVYTSCLLLSGANRGCSVNTEIDKKKMFVKKNEVTR